MPRTSATCRARWKTSSSPRSVSTTPSPACLRYRAAGRVAGREDNTFGIKNYGGKRTAAASPSRTPASPEVHARVGDALAVGERVRRARLLLALDQELSSMTPVRPPSPAVTCSAIRPPRPAGGGGPCRCCRGWRHHQPARQARPRDQVEGLGHVAGLRSSARTAARRITWVSGLPAVVTTAAAPLGVTPKNVCLVADARQASPPPARPVGAVLEPDRMDRPEASWRWTWLSGVRARSRPRSPRPRCTAAVIGSSHSQPPAGRARRCRAGAAARCAGRGARRARRPCPGR